MKRWVRYILVVWFMVMMTAGSTVKSEAFITNWGECFRFAILGPCMIGPVPGVTVIYWIPTAIVETSPQCGETIVPWAIPEVLAATATPCGLLAGGGSSYRPEDPKKDLHFAEVHVFEDAFDLVDMVTDVLDKMCFVLDTPLPRFLYLSEIDFVHWRTGFMDLERPETLMAPTCGVVSTLNPACMGSWGPIFPRTGWLEAQSQLVHSAGLAYRGVSEAQEKGGYIGGMTPLDSLQLAYPMVSRCIQIGEPSLLWEFGQDQVFNVNQHFVWVYWRFVTCCIP